MADPPPETRTSEHSGGPTPRCEGSPQREETMNSQHDAAPGTGTGQHAGAGGGSGRDEFPGAPRWVVLGIVGGAALVVAGILQNTLGAAGMVGH